MRSVTRQPFQIPLASPDAASCTRSGNPDVWGTHSGRRRLHRPLEQADWLCWIIGFLQSTDVSPRSEGRRTRKPAPWWTSPRLKYLAAWAIAKLSSANCLLFLGGDWSCRAEVCSAASARCNSNGCMAYKYREPRCLQVARHAPRRLQPSKSSSAQSIVQSSQQKASRSARLGSVSASVGTRAGRATSCISVIAAAKARLVESKNTVRMLLLVRRAPTSEDGNRQSIYFQ